MGTVNNVMQLTFLTNTDESVQINIPRANASITYPDVKNLMKTLIECNIVITGKGTLAKPIGAEIVATDTTPLKLS